MRLHTITDIKLYGAGDARILLRFDDRGPELNAMVDLSPMLAQGGVFERLRDPNIFQSVEIGRDGRTLIWKIGEGEDDVVDLCADALWLMARSVENPTAAND
jgi:hypothetical protein